MKKILCVVLACVLFSGILAACAKSEEPAPSRSQAVASQPQSEPEPLNAAYLTGLEKAPGDTDDKRVAAIMVNNITDSRPYQGLSQADIIVEIVTEGGITRFMGMFSNYEEVPRTGSVRSLRDQFFRIMYPAEPFIVHAGESTTARDYLDRYEYEGFNIGDESPLYLERDQGRLSAGYSYEFTAYTSGEGLKNFVDEAGMEGEKSYGGTTFLDFVPYNEPERDPEGGSIASFLITHSDGYKTQFDYDEASGQYKMSQFYDYSATIEPAIDEGNNEQLAVDNALVLFTSITPYPGSYVPFVDLAEGTGYYFTNGRFEKLNWKKGESEDPLLFYKENGEELLVNPGRTYLSVVNTEHQAAFEEALPAPAATTSGTGSAATSGATSGVEP